MRKIIKTFFDKIIFLIFIEEVRKVHKKRNETKAFLWMTKAFNSPVFLIYLCIIFCMHFKMIKLKQVEKKSKLS